MRDSVCIVDVGSASVGVSMVREGKEKGKPELSRSTRIQISDGSETSKDGIVPLMQAAAAKAFETLQGAGAPKYVRVVLAAPWYHPKIRTIVSRSEKTVKVTPATIARAVKEYFAKKDAPPQGELIESAVSQAYVNGYPTLLKHAVTGNYLKINHYQAEADPHITRALAEAAKKVFPHAEVTFHSFSFVAFSALRSLRSEDNFVIADVGGEITDVAVAHHDGLRFIGTFPIGTHAIIRALAGKSSVADSISRLALYAKGELSVEETAAVETSFAPAAAEWNKNFQDMLTAAVEEVAVPQTTFVFAEKDELAWLEKLVTGSHGSFSSRAIPVTPDFFHSAVTLGDGALYDAYLSAEALYFDSLYAHIQDLA